MYLGVLLIRSKAHYSEEAIAVHRRTAESIRGELAVKDTDRSIVPLEQEELELNTGQHVPEDDQAIMAGREKDPGISRVSF